MATDPTGRISHIDEMHRGQTWKRACRVATTANITLSGTQTIDGVAVVAGDRVLVKNQSTGSQNGIYDCAAGAWARAYDMDQDGTTAVPAEEVYGAVIAVAEGTTNGGTLWRNTNTGSITLGSTALTFEELSSTTSSSSGMVPTFIASGDTFTVPADFQALFALTIDNEGTLDVEGDLVMVD